MKTKNMFKELKSDLPASIVVFLWLFPYVLVSPWHQSGAIGIVGGTHDITTGEVNFYDDTLIIK